MKTWHVMVDDPEGPCMFFLVPAPYPGAPAPAHAVDAESGWPLTEFGRVEAPNEGVAASMAYALLRDAFPIGHLHRMH